MFILIMGIAGSGKSTLMHLLPFENTLKLDADDFHSDEAKLKMRQGQGLTDAERWPWLARVKQAMEQGLNKSQYENVILACSALKQSYRDYLSRNADELLIIYLKVDDSDSFNLLKERIAHRKLSNPNAVDESLLFSQLATLEEPESNENCLVLSISQDLKILVKEIMNFIDKKMD